MNGENDKEMDELCCLVQDLYGVKVESIRKLYSYEDKNYLIHKNSYKPEKFVLKIVSTQNSQNSSKKLD